MSNDPQNQDSLGDKLKATFDNNNSDKNYNLLKAGIGSIPSVGALILGVAEGYLVPPATKRLREFLETLVRGFEELKLKIDLVDFDSPAFQTIFIHTCQIVTRTHQDQKLEALRNIVFNSAIPRPLEDDILAMFLNWIDVFTERHISTLKHLHYIETYTLEELQAHFSLLEKNRSIYNKVLVDLAEQGLINLKESYITMEDDSISPTVRMMMADIPLDMYTQRRPPKKARESEIQMKTFKYREDIDALLRESSFSSQTRKTTELGKQFIEFIESPFI